MLGYILKDSKTKSYLLVFPENNTTFSFEGLTKKLSKIGTPLYHLHQWPYAVSVNLKTPEDIKNIDEQTLCSLLEKYPRRIVIDNITYRHLPLIKISEVDNAVFGAEKTNDNAPNSTGTKAMRTEAEARANPLPGDTWSFQSRYSPNLWYRYTLKESTAEKAYWIADWLDKQGLAIKQKIRPGQSGEVFVENVTLPYVQAPVLNPCSEIIEPGQHPGHELTLKDNTMRINSAVLITLALATTKDGAVAADRIPEGPLKEAFADAQAAREKERKAQLGNEVLALLNDHDTRTTAFAERIRYAKSELDRAYSDQKKVVRAFQYGMNTGNFVPYIVATNPATARRPDHITVAEWEVLCTVPADFKSE